MHVELLDYRCDSEHGDAGSDVEALACSTTELPIIAVTPDAGLSGLASLGVTPAVRVSPVAHSARLTVRALRRALSAFGATAVRCRSPYAQRMADLTGLPLSIDLVPPKLSVPPGHISRETIRRHLGLAPTDRFFVPLSARASDINSILLGMCAGALSIAEIPLVTALPHAARHAQRTRRQMSSSDRPLDVIATHIPMLALAPAADVLMWGPHADRTRFDPYGPEIESWARQFGVPFLCSNTILETILAHDDLTPRAADRLVPCNGTSGAEIASAVLAALDIQFAD